MKIFNSLTDFPTPPQGCVLTIGNFDGVHKGHQAIIQQAHSVAQNSHLPLVAMTFDPPPVTLLRPDKTPAVLTPPPIKARLLQEQALDQLIIIKTTPEFLALTPAEFAEKILHNRLDARHIVEGQTFGFGHHRAGTMISLDQLAQRFGFTTHLVPAVKLTLHESSPIAVTSTLVRQLVSRAQLPQARICLGRYYLLAGRVVLGRGKGRRLGFPTANLELYTPDQLVPEDGVFAGYARLARDLDQAWNQKPPHPAAISIGRCETFENGHWQIEAHLLNYPAKAPSLQGQHMLLSLVEKIRPQQRFDSTEALAQAIQDDCRKIRQVLKRSEYP